MPEPIEPEPTESERPEPAFDTAAPDAPAEDAVSDEGITDLHAAPESHSSGPAWTDGDFARLSQGIKRPLSTAPGFESWPVDRDGAAAHSVGRNRPRRLWGRLLLVAAAATVLAIALLNPGPVAGAYHDLRLAWQNRIWEPAMHRRHFGAADSEVAGVVPVKATEASPRSENGMSSRGSSGTDRLDAAGGSSSASVATATSPLPAAVAGRSDIDVADVTRDEKAAADVRPAGAAVSGDTRSPGESVARAQHLLKRLGYYQSKVDGLDGPRTRAALRAFQRDKGLVPNGELDRRSEHALNVATGDPSSASPRHRR